MTNNVLFIYSMDDVYVYCTLYNDILRIAINLLETRENIKIESHSFYHIICDLFSWGSCKKKIFFEKKNPKWLIFQNRHFSKSPILKIFLWKFHGLVLGLVELIDAKGIDVAQPMADRRKQKNSLWAHVRQPNYHIG